MSLREGTRVKETYNGARPKVKFSMPYRVVREPDLQNLKRNFQHELLNEEREQSYPLREDVDGITVRHHRLRDRNKQSEDDDGRIPTTEQTHTGASIKPASFDGNGCQFNYVSFFNAGAELNEWSERQKGLYLAVSLRGQA